MSKRKQYYIALSLVLLGVLIVSLIFILWLKKRSSDPVFLVIIPLTVGLLAAWGLTNFFYKVGYYTKKQAKAFFDLCSGDGISEVTFKNVGACQKHYRTAVSEFAKLPKQNELKIMKEAFNEGRSLSVGR